LNFRKDINGLRAIAVVAVVLFHFNPIWVSGGFAGVDIFFVISGFLMTGIIFRKMESNSFSILSFYVSRANRIVPALAFLCFSLLVLGWLYLIPSDFKLLSKHISGSISFLSNIMYSREGGYFATSSHEKWLLHTWSLSVEWQFYLIYPLILVVLKKLLSIRTMKFVLLLGTIVALLFSMFATYKLQNETYFPLHTRAWEMMMGGVAYLFPFKLNGKNKLRMEIVGVFLILLSYFYISKDDAWPGYLTLLPVLGAFSILQANRNDSLITSNFILQKLGLWSYSIYLWHWPVVVALYYLGLNDITSILIGIGISLILGITSYYFIEKKLSFAKPQINFIGLLKYPPLALIFITGAIGTTVYINNGYQERSSTEYLNVVKSISMPTRQNGYCFYDLNMGVEYQADALKGSSCILGDKKEKPSILLMGDSFAAQYEPFWDSLLRDHELALSSITTNWCSPSFTDRFIGPDDDNAFEQCIVNRQFIQKNMKRYKTVILSGLWGSVYHKGYMDDVYEVVDYASELGLNVIIMASPMSFGFDVTKRFKTAIFNGDLNLDMPPIIENSDDTAIEANRLFNELSQKRNNVLFISRDDLFDPSNMYTKNGIKLPYSLDGSHISLEGSLKSALYFSQTETHEKIMKFISTRNYSKL
jgi:peptidoglycan/LPS O-acetylase OafA/YrhL